MPRNPGSNPGSPAAKPSGVHGNIRSYGASLPHLFAEEAGEAIAKSKSYAEALRWMGMCASGGATTTLRKWAERWGIPTRHFDPYDNQRLSRGRERRPLAEVMVENSTFNRGH